MTKNITAIQKEENGTIRLTVTIPYSDIKKTWDIAIDDAVKNAELPGFRKGKAPKKLVEEKLDREKVKEDVLRTLLPTAYSEAVKTHNLKPIVNPKIHVDKIDDLDKLDDKKGWQFIAITCEAPDVKLGKYKDAIKIITAKSKIIIPGKENDKNAPKLDEIVKALLENVTVQVPQLLVDRETERLLAQTIDDVKKLGLTLDQYLSSTGRNAETLKQEYSKKATNDLTLEFALVKIAEEERITVEEKEIQEAVQKTNPPTGGEEERKHLESNRYLLTSILRQQKTLDFLKNL
jgi:FKBP-type peptidyl-prolyl cis-trans isomerase (trigger factor)